MSVSNKTLGPNIVELLLPHRPPFLMVDNIESFDLDDKPTMRCSRMISANEPVFAGHFPGLKLWPGAYTLEGLGQCCNLLVVLLGLREYCRENGIDVDEPIRVLHHLELGYRLHPGFREDRVREFVSLLRKAPLRLGVSAAFDVRLLQPVFAGQRLDYEVSQTHRVEMMERCDVEARVGQRVVAQGTITGSAGHTVPLASFL